MSHSMDERREAQKAKAHERLREIERRASTRGVKLPNVDRLKAALALTALWADCKKTKIPQGRIEEQVYQRRLSRTHKGSEEFRLKRWLLPQSVQELTPEFIRQQASKPTPQRDLDAYLVAISVMAEALGRSPDDEKIGMLSGLSMWTGHGQREKDPDVDIPGENLEVILHKMTRSLAQDTDLPGICERLERLSCQWNPYLETLHLAPRGQTLRRSLSDPATLPTEGEAAFPYPAIPVVGLYYGYTEGEASVVPSDPPISFVQPNKLSPHPAFLPGARPDEPASGWAPARFHVYRRVSLEIRCEPGRYPMPAFISRADVVLGLQDPDRGFLRPDLGIELKGVMDIFHSLQPENSDYADMYETPVGYFADNHWHHVFARFTNGTTERSGYYGLSPDEFPFDPLQGSAGPYDHAVFWSHTSATAPYIRAWLGEARPMLGVAPRRPLELPPEALSGEGLPAWDELNFPIDCPARDLELALHDGRIEEAFRDRIGHLHRMAEALETDWVDGRERGTEALLKRWFRPSRSPGTN
ncbi:hypothetical protein FHG66_11340 [Rubellimicrobium rubrum]|uniref:Uncharacterized protein n=1 Tax=Rubellimicrobium rubrum TaxID=2585369 RepID=A0A5C4MYW8_9RHOB|nr:hypothetical protein [Rubellimicrobium rubrum]TNC49320.1 hypothetical protein FHG66_11340 [Rubellimicrobium rubrum]